MNDTMNRRVTICHTAVTSSSSSSSCFRTSRRYWFLPFIGLYFGFVVFVQHFHVQIMVSQQLPGGSPWEHNSMDLPILDGKDIRLLQSVPPPPPRMTTSSSYSVDNKNSHNHHPILNVTKNNQEKATDGTAVDTVTTATAVVDNHDDDGSLAFQTYLSDGKLLLEDIAAHSIQPPSLSSTTKTKTKTKMDHSHNGQNDGANQTVLSSSSTTSIPPRPTMTCGAVKCFIESKHYPQYGYTIGQQLPRRTSYSKDIMMDTYKLAKRLERDHGMNHLYHPNVPPVEIPPSEDLYQFLKSVSGQD